MANLADTGVNSEAETAFLPKKESSFRFDKRCSSECSALMQTKPSAESASLKSLK